MQISLKSWEKSPLLRASTNVLDTPIKIMGGAPCVSPFTPRLNVGNIHEIKQFWNAPIQN
ncbi:hypothetical protein [Pseudomonas brassicacearum]|uniref:hypothetical protein n=1 Tax=Pseudomonas brassicacearum TaxID=930166 RepID=UPI001D82C196|nr:hypothetical protein [Pseudomonas brassicacearum]CAH0321184.1 hypothetical protein SRABI06_05478 [Pseudomonas brassicacearum]